MKKKFVFYCKSNVNKDYKNEVKKFFTDFRHQKSSSLE